ncbi:MAG: DUF1080 domain-containing protein [Lewinella sp.]|nr:DUF1080 domain-containing protein [Lewinella sp.]
MHRFLLLALIALQMTACKPAEPGNDPNSEEWISLFNGVNLDGWDIKISGHELNDNYLNTFLVEDSMIRISYVNYDSFGDNYGHMYYKEPYSYYRLVFDYRFVGEQTPGGAVWNNRNSGVMLHSQSAASNDFDQDFPVSVELQLLGGLGQGERPTANVCTPGTAVVMKDTVDFTHCINSTSKTYDGDQWVHAEAVVLGDESITHIIEGDTVLVFYKPQIGGGFISKTRGPDWANFGITHPEQWIEKEGTTLKEGYIALQAESHPIDFRNIRLLDLCGCMDKKAKNYKAYYVKDAPEKCVY